MVQVHLSARIYRRYSHWSGVCFACLYELLALRDAYIVGLVPCFTTCTCTQDRNLILKKQLESLGKRANLKVTMRYVDVSNILLHVELFTGVNFVKWRGIPKVSELWNCPKWIGIAWWNAKELVTLSLATWRSRRTERRGIKVAEAGEKRKRRREVAGKEVDVMERMLVLLNDLEVSAMIYRFVVSTSFPILIAGEFHLKRVSQGP